MSDDLHPARALQTYLRRAGRLLGQHELDAALEEVNAALLIDPASVPAHALLEQIESARRVSQPFLPTLEPPPWLDLEVVAPATVAAEADDDPFADDDLGFLNDEKATLPATDDASSTDRFRTRALHAVSLLLVGVSLLIGLDRVRAPGTASAAAPEPSPSASSVRASGVRIAESALDLSAVPSSELDRGRAGEPFRASGEPLQAAGEPLHAGEWDDASDPGLPVSTSGPERRTFRSGEPETIDGEIPDDYVAPQSRSGSARPASPEAGSRGGVRPASSTGLAPSSTGLAPSSTGLALNATRRPEGIEPVSGTGAFAVPPLDADEGSVAKVLSRYALERLARQDVRFERCDISVRGTVANASCRASEETAAVRPGNPAEPRQWRFTLRRTGQLWKVQTAEARQSN